MTSATIAPSATGEEVMSPDNPLACAGNQTWRNSLIAPQFRLLCLHFVGLEQHYGLSFRTIQRRLHKILRRPNKALLLAMVQKQLPELYGNIFEYRASNQAASWIGIMRHLQYHAAVADTLANNRLVTTQPDDRGHELTLRYALMYDTGILLQDVQADATLALETVGQLPLELVGNLRHHLRYHCNFTLHDFVWLKELLTCQTDTEFMQALGSLVKAFHKHRGMWGMLDYLKQHPILSIETKVA